MQVNRLIVVIGVALLGASAFAQGKSETWRCQSGVLWLDGGQIVVIVKHDGSHSGTVQVAGVTQKAQFEVSGFDRRWDFGELLKSGIFNTALLSVQMERHATLTSPRRMRKAWYPRTASTSVKRTDFA